MSEIEFITQDDVKKFQKECWHEFVYLNDKIYCQKCYQPRYKTSKTEEHLINNLEKLKMLEYNSFFRKLHYFIFN